MNVVVFNPHIGDLCKGHAVHANGGDLVVGNIHLVAFADDQASVVTRNMIACDGHVFTKAHRQPDAISMPIRQCPCATCQFPLYPIARQRQVLAVGKGKRAHIQLVCAVKCVAKDHATDAQPIKFRNLQSAQDGRVLRVGRANFCRDLIPTQHKRVIDPGG